MAKPVGLDVDPGSDTSSSKPNYNLASQAPPGQATQSEYGLDNQSASELQQHPGSMGSGGGSGAAQRPTIARQESLQGRVPSTGSIKVLSVFMLSLTYFHFTLVIIIINQVLLWRSNVASHHTAPYKKHQK